MILTSDTLIKELLKDDDDFITVVLNNEEYIIESVGRISDCVDKPVSHKCINIRYKEGNGHIIR